MVIKMLKGKFIGKDGSMGFKYGKKYKLYIRCNNNWIYVSTTDGLYCPYLNLEKLLENWIIYGVIKNEH